MIRGKLPENLHLIGVQPVSLEIGVEMSAPVAAQMDEVETRTLRVLAGWGVAVPVR
jgi:Ni,Fe-hydrogenase maturation factor